MLRKKATRQINPHDEPLGFYSTMFLTKKSLGGWRTILNLKPLNKVSISPVKLCQETLRSVLTSLGKARARKELDLHLDPGRLQEPCPWATTIDMKDAYFHVLIHPEFLILPFGLSTSPRVFTKIVGALAAFLHQQGVQMFPYLDDWLVNPETYSLSRFTTQTCFRSGQSS